MTAWKKAVRRPPARTSGPLYRQVRAVLEAARAGAYRAVNAAMVAAYWQVGRLIVEHEQGGRRRAAYGEAVLEELSRRLCADFGRGFTPTNLRYMRQFYRAFPIHHASRDESGRPSLPVGLRAELSWTHYRLLSLVFYNYLLRCFVLIDLKVGKLTHQDIGQMDSYVRVFDAHARPEGDNPTIGLVLCSRKNEAIARYSVLSEGRQIFAARYVKLLPSEEQLAREIARERRVIEQGTRRGGAS